MENPLKDVKEIVQITPEDLATLFSEYVNKKHTLVQESVETSRYAIDVNYRTTMDDVSFGFAKIALGYVSAALKRMGYHIKMVFSEKPLRVIVSSRNWDDGEWVGMICYNAQLGCFILSKGHYNRMKKSVNVVSSEKIDSKPSASEMAAKLKEKMASIENLPSKKNLEIKVNLKRGPKS
jgi:hypothetical protein